jgi:hypothetical protein
MKFEVHSQSIQMRNAFLEAKSKPPSSLKSLRQFFNRTDVCRFNILQALSAEACSNIAQLLDALPPR